MHFVNHADIYSSQSKKLANARGIEEVLLDREVLLHLQQGGRELHPVGAGPSRPGGGRRGEQGNGGGETCQRCLTMFGIIQ